MNPTIKVYSDVYHELKKNELNYIMQYIE